MRKNVARRILVAAVTIAFAFMLLAVAATPAEAKRCPFGLKLIKWPQGVAPDYNHNGFVCSGYSSRIGMYVTTDDI